MGILEHLERLEGIDVLAGPAGLVGFVGLESLECLENSVGSYKLPLIEGVGHGEVDAAFVFGIHWSGA